MARVDRGRIEKEEKREGKKSTQSGINKNRDPATAQVAVEMEIKQQKAFCGRNKLKSVSRHEQRNGAASGVRL